MNSDFCFADRVIALTGGIGSGKSSVGQWFRENAAWTYINADVLVADLLAKNADGWLRLRDILGDGFFLADGMIDKASLRSAIFTDASLRTSVEGVLHPLVFEKIRSVVRGVAREVCCLVEVPLLYEVGWQRHFKKVVVVYAAYDACASRIQQRDAIGRDEAGLEINTQFPIVGKAKRADYVIDNSGSWSETIKQLEKLQKELDTSWSMS